MSRRLRWYGRNQNQKQNSNMADVWANSMVCHARATCHIAGCCHLVKSMSWSCHIAECKNSIRHIENRSSPYIFLVFVFKCSLRFDDGGFRIVSDTLVSFCTAYVSRDLWRRAYQLINMSLHDSLRLNNHLVGIDESEIETIGKLDAHRFLASSFFDRRSHVTMHSDAVNTPIRQRRNSTAQRLGPDYITTTSRIPTLPCNDMKRGRR